MEKNILSLLFCFFIMVSLYATEDVDYIDIIEGNRANNNILYENVQIASSGIILNGNTVEGSISQTIKSQIAFNAATIAWIGQTPESSSIKVEFSALLKTGEWSSWESIQQGGSDVILSNIALAYRYKVTLYSENLSLSPVLEKLVISYNEIYSEMLYKEFAPWANATRGVSKPAVVSRAEWGARPPKSSYTYHTPQKITIHHTWRPTSTEYQGNSTIRSIQNYHMDSNGWADIGYHFLIGTYRSSGETKIYQGRPENVVGAHTGGANTNNVGVNVIGDYTVETVHGNSYQALIKLLGWLCSHYSINPDNIYGHCDLNSTACPGTNLYSLRAKIRQDVRNYINGGSSQGKLMGVIYDAAQGTQAKISGACVTLHTGNSTTTGSDGVYCFELSPGTYKIEAKKSGYQTGNSSETVVDGQTIWESIGLKK